jgi:tetratricopeptide (TPR) repeat protein
LHPVTAQIARTADFDSKDPPDTKLDKLERLLARSGAPIEGTAPLLAALVSVPCDHRYPPMDLSARRQKDATFEVLTEHLTRLASHQPVLMVVEDVHWADPTTLEFLGQVVQRLHSMRMLAVFTFRPEFRPPWSAPGRTSRIALGRLSQPERRELVARLAYGASLPNQALEQIAAKTDGVPLFVEELTKAVLEARTAAQRPDGLDPGDPALILPDSLQDSLMARLDHLATVRETAQIGAVIGREFSHELLAAVARRDERDLQSDLDRLVEAGLIFAQKPAPGTSYAFKHALVRDAAYATLLRARRRQLHTQVAQVLEKQFSEIVEREPETIARHYEAAGLDLQAILYWLRAGEWASDRSANAEAESHLRRALVLIEKLPDRSEHQQLELRALTALGHVLIAKSGYGSPDVETIYSRANRLCETIGQEATVFPILLGLAIYSAVRAELDTGLSLSRRLVDLADQASDAVLKVEAHYSAGIIHHWRGEFVRARHHLTSAAEMYRTEQHKTHLAIYGQDPGPICLCRGAAVLWHLGYPDQAQAQMEDALRLADQLSHPFSRTYVLAWAAWLRILRREVAEAEQLIGLATWFAREQGYPYWIALMTQYEGWLLAQKGDPHLAIARLEKGLLETHAVGTRVTCAYASGLLGQELAKVGRASDGVHLIEQALDHVRTRQERWCEAELLRLQGEVLLTVGLNDCNAEAAMRLATGRAQEQNAKGWELRATTSLARLWAEQGQRAKARDILGPVYHWFTEGFHTTDLKEARDLLETLT